MNTLKVNVGQVILIMLAVTIALYSEFFISYQTVSDQSGLWTASFCVTIIYIISSLIIFKECHSNWTHPIVIFLGMLGLFICNRFILHFLGLTKIENPNFMDFEPLNIEYIIITARIIYIFLISFCISMVFFLKNNESQPCWHLKHDSFILQFGFFFMFIGALPAYFIQYKFYLDFISIGYLNLFIHEIAYSPPIYVKLPAMLFRLGFFLILISIPTRRQFFIAFVIFLPFIMLNLMTGIRGYYFSFLLTILFYYYNVLNPGEFSIKKLVAFIVVIVLLGDFFASYRLGLDPFSTGILVFYSFIYDQGTSILAVVHAVSLKSQGLLNGSFLNLFDSLLSPDFMLQDKVDMLVSPQSKKQGFSLGGSIFQESYLIGGFGLVITVGFFIPVLLKMIINLSIRNRYILSLLLMILPNVIFSPRSRLLDFILKNFSYFIIFIIILFLINIIRRRIENITYST